MTMLDRMRRHKNWLKWSLALVVLTFVVFYIPDFLSSTDAVGGTAVSGRVARVGSRDISGTDFRNRYQLQLQAYSNAYGGNLTDQMLRQLQIEQQILQQMIEERVQLAEADRLGLSVTDEEVRGRILSMPGLQENGQFIGEARYRELLRVQRPPLTPRQFEDQIRNALVLEKLRATLTGWISLTDQELQQEYRRRNEKVKLQIVSLPISGFDSQVTVSESEMTSAFESGKEKYRIPERRKIRYMLLDLETARAKSTVTDAEIQAEYNRRSPEYTTQEEIRASHILLRTEGKNEEEVRATAEDVLKQARAGADFAGLAKKYSDDDANRDQGGDLDFFTRGRMVPEFEDVAFKLTPGQISDLVKTQYGFHIIKLVDKKPGSVKPLSEVRQQIMEQLRADAAAQQLGQLAQRLEGEIRTKADLERSAKSQGLAIQESGFFGRNDLVPGLGLAPAVADRAFQMGDNDVSGAVRASRGEVFFVLAGKEAAHLPKLDEVKDRVRADIVKQKAGELAKQKATELATALQTAPDFVKAAKTAGFETQTTELVARDSVLPTLGVSPAADKAAFSLPVGGVSGPVASESAYGVIKVVERQEMKPEEFNSAKPTFRDEILNERRGRFFASYMERARQKIRIDVNQEAVQRAIS
ncbi:MAG TPA: peptidylprolyl isomerase [Vicinamibacterales bacterium]